MDARGKTICFPNLPGWGGGGGGGGGGKRHKYEIMYTSLVAPEEYYLIGTVSTGSQLSKGYTFYIKWQQEMSEDEKTTQNPKSPY